MSLRGHFWHTRFPSAIFSPDICREKGEMNSDMLRMWFGTLRDRCGRPLMGEEGFLRTERMRYSQLKPRLPQRQPVTCQQMEESRDEPLVCIFLLEPDNLMGGINGLMVRQRSGDVCIGGTERGSTSLSSMALLPYSSGDAGACSRLWPVQGIDLGHGYMRRIVKVGVWSAVVLSLRR
jgi:hypothetical protein